MKRKNLFYLFMMIIAAAFTGCSNDEKPGGVTTVISKKPVIMEPFRYHKLIEVSPGQDYDVLSWGRGSATVGSFMILHSDSAAAKYVTTTGDLTGSIVDVYNSDMDLDGNPEILIQAKTNDTINYTNIYAFEFTNDKAQKLDFPRLTQTQRQGYRGDDNFYIKDGMLMREFPIYKGSGKDAKPTGAKRQFQYGLRNNEFTVKQLSKDSTSVSPVKPKVTVAAKGAVTTKKGVVTAKKHTVEKKHKKKHRRHSSDEG
jgi:hypothetical protein